MYLLFGCSFICGILQCKQSWNSQNTQAGVFCWHGESSDPRNQIVPSDTSPLRDYGDIVSAEDGSFTITVTHANFNNQGKPSNSFNAENLSPTPKATPYELTSHERDSALLRYREKKKTRRYLVFFVVTFYFFIKILLEI